MPFVLRGLCPSRCCAALKAQQSAGAPAQVAPAAALASRCEAWRAAAADLALKTRARNEYEDPPSHARLRLRPAR